MFMVKSTSFWHGFIYYSVPFEDTVASYYPRDHNIKSQFKCLDQTGNVYIGPVNIE